MEMNILPDGNIETLYTDKIDLSAIGRLNINRASNVEYCNEKQGWMVKIIGTKMIFGPFECRQEALKAEVAFLNIKMEETPGYSRRQR